MSTTKKSDCLTIEAWNPKEIHYQQPRKSKVGKDIYLSSTQLNSRLTLQSPLMKTWGIADYIDDKGNAQGRYSMSLNFQNEGYSTPEQDLFKAKLQEFQAKILQDAYDNRLAWFGDDELSLDVIKSKMIPILKYPKLKDDKGQPTKKSDLSKAPTISLKVPNYDNKWNCEIYDMEKNRLFPSEDPHQTPIDFVMKGSEIITKFQCNCIWTGDMMWGVKWSLVLGFVKPNEKLNLFDTSSIQLPDMTSTPSVEPIATAAKPVKATPAPTPTVIAEKSVVVEDSDDEASPPLIKQSSVPLEVPETEEEEEEVVVEKPKPKVLKKKVIK